LQSYPFFIGLGILDKLIYKIRRGGTKQTTRTYRPQQTTQ